MFNLRSNSAVMKLKQEIIILTWSTQLLITVSCFLTNSIIGTRREESTETCIQLIRRLLMIFIGHQDQNGEQGCIYFNNISTTMQRKYQCLERGSLLEN